MERYFKKAATPLLGTQGQETNRKRARLDRNSNFEVPPDPGLRPPISNYDPNDHDFVRRQYLLAGPRQPMLQDFPQTLFGDKQRRFNKAWYNQYPYWLEYSIQKDAAYCLCCYLFKTENREGGGDAFTSAGFKNWKSKKSLDEHVGGLNSAHNVAVSKCQNLMKQEQSIQTVLEGQSKRSQNAYRLRLTASLDCIRFLLRQGLAFRGNDESEGSSNRGNFLELLRFLADHNAMIEGVVLQNAPKNMKLVAPEIQKDIIAAAAAETTNKIMEELGDELFSVLVDESRDVSCKEQMAVILRFVNKQGSIVERFLAVVHVKETTSLSLKTSLEELFCKHKLSFSRLRGQGYDGASNMRGEFNGLKALILKENSSAYYVHCFAHQLQLVLVAVAERHKRIATLFNTISTAQNTVGASCQRRDKLREERAAEVKKALVEGDISSGTGLHQEVPLPNRLGGKRVTPPLPSRQEGIALGLGGKREFTIRIALSNRPKPGISRLRGVVI
ncbi:hypothetical protein LUZ61_007250 [Rhynchospora tenuis]|uniref:TTF-type domain-containing protein n=1 Tax=Rhynchospora tenuis TaxID=198213 RepID=A0AAD5ZT53_9POAL|nr:hypothetical protein LUZ61_007250 [Rhynchospora tenuis]